MQEWVTLECDEESLRLVQEVQMIAAHAGKLLDSELTCLLEPAFADLYARCVGLRAHLRRLGFHDGHFTGPVDGASLARSLAAS